jgi:hypothetical protein
LSLSRTAAPAASPGIYAGLFFTTLSTLMYEILLTRIFSVTMWYHFAFVAVSVALFGLTVGALIVYLSPQRFTEEQLRTRLGQATLLFSVSIAVSFLTQLAIPFDPRWSVVSVYSVALTYFVIATPFIFGGIAVCLVLTKFPAHVSRLYAVDLLGAGLGAVSLIWLLRLLKDGPSAVLAVAGLAAIGAWCFARDDPRPRLRNAALACAAVLIALAAGNAFGAQHSHAVLRIRWAKGLYEADHDYEEWNAFSRINVIGDGVAPKQPFGWGFGSRTPLTATARERQLLIDAAAGTAITNYNGDPTTLEYLKYDVTNIVHYIRADADLLVIGSGGGRDVLSGLAFGQRSIKAIELNSAILDVVNGRYGDFTGHLDQQPGVTFVNDEARSYLARSDERFDVIQISLIDTWAATAAGAFALSENSLYTVEAWDTFLDRLNPDGVLSVSRWFFPDGPMESHRLVSLGAKVLRDRGVESPRDHMILVKNPFNEFDVSVGTLLVSPRPFSSDDVTQVALAASAVGLEVVLAPGLASDPVFQRLAEDPNVEASDVGFSGDISAPTDDRPFFFQMLRFQDVFDSGLYGGSSGGLVTQPVLVLFSLTVSVLGLTALCILLPLALTTSRESLRGTLPLILFFCGIGLGFLLIEIAQMQRLTVFLGHPTYALSVVLFSLLVFSGLGSLATEWLAAPKANPGLRATTLAPLAVLLPVLVAFGFTTPDLIHQFDGETTPVRIAVAVAVLAPMGLLMGMPFPLGMKVASLRENAPTAFFWGINGATSVCASVLAVAIALGWGISASFWAGCGAYALAAAALGLVVLRQR